MTQPRVGWEWRGCRAGFAVCQSAETRKAVGSGRGRVQSYSLYREAGEQVAFFKKKGNPKSLFSTEAQIVKELSVEAEAPGGFLSACGVQAPKGKD